MSTAQPKQYDAIIIGTGIGGLTIGSLLQEFCHYNILFVEKSAKPGGQTHKFGRKGKWEWDVGLHYVGEMNHDTMPRKILDFITNGKVDWEPLHPDFDRFIFPDFDFAFPEGSSAFKQRLIETFPDEQASIEHLFEDIEAVVRWYRNDFNAKSSGGLQSALFGFLKKTGNKRALQTTAQYLDSNFKSPKLKALLAGQWPDYGLPPSKSAFAIHALIMHHYLNGAAVPKGGSNLISKAAIEKLQEQGAEVVTHTEVEQILVENGKTTGIKGTTNKGKFVDPFEAHAPLVISTAGAYNTYRHLVPEQYQPQSLLANLEQINQGASSISVFLGLKQDPANLGFEQANYWIYTGYDHDQLYSNCHLALEGKPQSAFLSFPSLKGSTSPEPTAVIIAPATYDLFEKWANQTCKRRDDDYKALKETITEGLLNLVESKFPGFKDNVEFAEAGTPLTAVHYLNWPKGGYYGVPATQTRFTEEGLNAKTPMPGLYLAGTDVGVGGIVGSMMGSVQTAAMLIKGGMQAIWKQLL